MLLFAKLNVAAGVEVQEIAERMQQQHGINDCVNTELTVIGKQSKKLYEETVMELMLRMILKKRKFSDDSLVYALKLAERESENILSSKLWLQIRSTCSQIIQNGNKKDWIWLKICLLPSTIRYKDISKDSNDDPNYLYYALLKIVSVEAMSQINKLDENLMKMASQQKDDWLALVEWDIPDEYDSVRQDKIMNGITSPYTFDQLSESSGTTFNSPSFYDYNQYLSQLALLAQIGTYPLSVFPSVFPSVFAFTHDLQIS